MKIMQLTVHEAYYDSLVIDYLHSAHCSVNYVDPNSLQNYHGRRQA